MRLGTWTLSAGLALVPVLLLMAAIFGEPCAARPAIGQSPWLHHAPGHGSKFVRNRPKPPVQVVAEPVAAPPPPPPPEAGSRPAVRSRAFYDCMSSCLTLTQYNPVCGTDQTTYHNEYKLECANRCGAHPKVTVQRNGIC